MTNTKTSTVHPALAKACPACKTAAGIPCVASVELSSRSGAFVLVKSVDGSTKGLVHKRRMPKGSGTRVKAVTRGSTAQGEWILARTEAPAPKAARTCVRAYYRSQGGEVLAVDCGPMTWQAAEALEWDLTGTHSDCLRVETLGWSLRGDQAARYDGRAVRVVTLPSQVIDGVERMPDSTDEDAQDSDCDGGVRLVGKVARPVGRSVQADWLAQLAV